MSTLEDFHYANKYKKDTREIERTLIISPDVFKVTHMIMFRVPVIMGREMDWINNMEGVVWLGCGYGHTLQAIVFDMGIDYPWHEKNYCNVMWQKPSDIWNIWLAAAIILRNYGFEMDVSCPILG